MAKYQQPVIKVYVAANDVARAEYVRQFRGAPAHWWVGRFLNGTETAHLVIPVGSTYTVEKIKAQVVAWLEGQGATVRP
jgi:hypothetical protein